MTLTPKQFREEQQRRNPASTAQRSSDHLARLIAIGLMALGFWLLAAMLLKG